MNRRHRQQAACSVLLLSALALAAGAPAAHADAGGTATAVLLGPPVTVGTAGNEPIVKVAPDGTVYVAALQHLYVSTDHGVSFTQPSPSFYNGQGNLVSDSSIDVDPAGRLYLAVNYPYAGTVAVCTSDDRAATTSCDPATVPGGNDRQWLTAPTTTASYLTTNVGLYQTIFLSSHDRGATYTQNAATTSSVANPNDGPPLRRSQDGLVYQPFVNASSNQSALDNELSGPIQVHVWDPTTSPTAVTPKAELSTPLQAGAAINDLVATPDGTLYLASEGVSGTDSSGNPTGKDVRIARSTDAGQTWTVLPALPGTSTGTSAFAWIAAGKDGHLGVVYYRTDSGGRADTATGSWDTYWAETTDATSATPGWQTQLVESGVHTGHLCTTAGCMNSDRFAGDFLGAAFDSADRPYVSWMRQKADGTTEIRFAGPATGATGTPAAALPEAGHVAALPVVGLLGTGIWLGARRRRSTTVRRRAAG